MKSSLSKTQAQEKINDFFKHPSFHPKDLKKIKRLAMKFNIKLHPFKKKFCKSCLLPLKGKIKISSSHKTIQCHNCNNKNKIRIKKEN